MSDTSRAGDVLARIVGAMQVAHATSGCPRRLSRQHAWQECAWTPSLYAAADALDAADGGGTQVTVARRLSPSDAYPCNPPAMCCWEKVTVPADQVLDSDRPVPTDVPF